jgi:hypothetical protein
MDDIPEMTIFERSDSFSNERKESFFIILFSIIFMYRSIQESNVQFVSTLHPDMRMIEI